MKRSHLQALTAALAGQAHLVASLHVLSQPALDADDHEFLCEHAASLHAIDLLRWLARCPADGPRARVIRRLADDARRRPERFEAEVLGARLDFITDDDWAELFDQLAPSCSPRLARRLLERTSGCPTYRALLAARPAPPPDPCLFPHAVDPFGLLSEAPAPQPSRGGLDLARSLFDVRNDERRCLVALQLALRSGDGAQTLLALAGAGLVDRMEDPAIGLPAEVRFTCEHGDDERAAGDAALRALAAHGLGEAGHRWLVAQVEAALERGAAAPALLGELCPAAIRALWPRGARLRAAVERALRGASAPGRRGLLRLLPADVADGLLVEADEAASPEARLALARDRAARAVDGGECVDLLAWLERHDASRNELMELAIAALGRGVEGNDLLAWTAARLATRSAYERHGAAALGALLSRGAWSALADLFAQSWSAAGGGDRSLTAGSAGEAGEATSAGFRQAAHGAFAQALVQQTRAALAAGQEGAALRALSALACLDPPSRLNTALHQLASRCPAGPVAELLAVNASMVKHGDGREATLQGLIAAVHVLSSR